MKSGFHGATAMMANLQTDIADTAHTGFTTLEQWATRVDRFFPGYQKWDRMHLVVRSREMRPSPCYAPVLI
jgi:hypothetical protein